MAVLKHPFLPLLTLEVDGAAVSRDGVRSADDLGENQHCAKMQIAHGMAARSSDLRNAFHTSMPSINICEGDTCMRTTDLWISPERKVPVQITICEHLIVSLILMIMNVSTVPSNIGRE